MNLTETIQAKIMADDGRQLSWRFSMGVVKSR